MHNNIYSYYIIIGRFFYKLSINIQLHNCKFNKIISHFSQKFKSIFIFGVIT